MKLRIYCMRCLQEKIFQGQVLPNVVRLLQEKNFEALKELLEKNKDVLKGFFVSDFCDVDIRDDGVYEMICSEGHKTYTLLQQLDFEIFFDLGAYAITDGYYREAVSSFTASLERFYEFYIKVISLKHGISDEVHETSWKLVSRQSERQIGAYIFLYTLENKITPKLPSNRDLSI
ncbi:MAG: hypothetical protein AB1442_05615 [Nitrospirota bacterium]